jgi:hypothetical protein
MKIDDAQKETVRKWIEDGLKLSEIQSRLSSELGVTMTYMEARFLMDDLKLQPKDKVLQKPVELKTAESKPAAPAEVTAAPGEPLPEAPGGMGGVSVTVDQIARAGALISGKVVFSDGKGAAWHLDQQGRLGVAPDEKGYKPSQADVMDFQNELQNVIARMGY